MDRKLARPLDVSEVSALGILPPALRSAQREGGSIDARPSPEATGPRVVPYTFAFTGDFERGELGLLWSLSSLGVLTPRSASV
jgi:hypothetical protein